MGELHFVLLLPTITNILNKGMARLLTLPTRCATSCPSWGKWLYSVLHGMRVCCDEEALPRALPASIKQEREAAAGRKRSFALMISSEER